MHALLIKSKTIIPSKPAQQIIFKLSSDDLITTAWSV